MKETSRLPSSHKSIFIVHWEQHGCSFSLSSEIQRKGRLIWCFFPNPAKGFAWILSLRILLMFFFSLWCTFKHHVCEEFKGAKWKLKKKQKTTDFQELKGQQNNHHTVKPLTLRRYPLLSTTRGGGEGGAGWDWRAHYKCSAGFNNVCRDIVVICSGEWHLQLGRNCMRLTTHKGCAHSREMSYRASWWLGQEHTGRFISSGAWKSVNSRFGNWTELWKTCSILICSSTKWRPPRDVDEVTYSVSHHITHLSTKQTLSIR